MFVHSVKMSNYKSIGSSDDRIILEPRTTAIIGKNESGKSNIISGLSHISFFSRMTEAFKNENINLINEESNEIVYEIVLKFREDEKKTYKIEEDTKIVITKESYFATGGIVDLYSKLIRSNILKLINMLEGNPFELRNQDLITFRNYVETLNQETALNLPSIKSAIEYFYKNKQRFPSENRENFSKLIKAIKETFERIIKMFPVVFYRDSSKILKTQYKLDEIKAELGDSNIKTKSLLYELVSLAEVSNEDFVLAAQSGSSSKQDSLRHKINYKINENINKKFKEFYSAEKLILSITFNAGNITFNIHPENGSESFHLSERSNGLRWYLNTFIDSLYHGVATENTLYLLDEPGTSLHVNAQKELLNLFENLTSLKNQIVYTTHSPYMLDIKNDGIHRIRAVEKDSSGYTHIYTTPYDNRLSKDNKKDTITPIVNALGMNLYDTIGPSKDKLNIVVEGISDYIYITAMAKYLKFDLSKYAFIPSIGASNCTSICSILYGWGCPFFVVFDYDKEGVFNGEKLSKNYMLEYGKNYCYVSLPSKQEIDDKTFKTNKKVIEDIVTKEEINRFKAAFPNSKSVDKALLAKLFSNAIENASYIPGEQCIANFKKLFNTIFQYK